jgi:hypothetical protein
VVSFAEVIIVNLSNEDKVLTPSLNEGRNLLDKKQQLETPCYSPSLSKKSNVLIDLNSKSSHLSSQELDND